MMDDYAANVRVVLEKILDGEGINKKAPTDSWAVAQMSVVNNSMSYFRAPSMKDKMKDYLRHRLVQCGWKDETQLDCVRILRERGVDNVSEEELKAEVYASARSRIPVEVKRELVSMLKEELMKELENSGMNP